MCRVSIAVVCMLLFSLPSIAAPDKIVHNPRVTTEFSPDQIAVYSFILKSYRTLLKPSYRDMLAVNFYLDEETEAIDVSDLKRGRGCLRGMDLGRVSKEVIPTVHNFFSQQHWLPSYVKPASRAKCKLVTPSGICWETEGTLSLSEIVFDKTHTHAVMAFRIGCGMQCGWGQTILLNKVNGHWHRKGVCEEIYI